MTQHTPGPWKLCTHLEDHDKCPCGYRGGIWSGDGELMVCEMGASKEHDGSQMMPQADRLTQFADARLIAAAPELLAALKAKLAVTDDEADIVADALAHAAVARAEGRTP